MFKFKRNIYKIPKGPFILPHPLFLHLLPEAFAHSHASSTCIGLWTLIRLFLFFLVEQIFPEDHHESQQKIKVCLFKFNCLV